MPESALFECKGYNGRSSAFTDRESGMSLSPLAEVQFHENTYLIGNTINKRPVIYDNTFHTTTYTQEQYYRVRQMLGRDFDKSKLLLINGRQVWPPVKEEPVKSQVVIIAYEVIKHSPEPQTAPGQPLVTSGTTGTPIGPTATDGTQGIEVLLGTAENVGALNHLIGLRWQFGKDTGRELNELFNADVRPGQEVRFFNFVFRRTILITTRC